MLNNQSLSIAKDKSSRQLLVSLLKILGASLLIALCARISIPLYFTPVVFTLQTCAVMLIGATLGSRIGALSVLAYIAEGVMGLPVFAQMNGFAELVGVHGGYFVGFVLQAYLVGWFMERQKNFSLVKTAAILSLSCLLQLGLGALWLSSFIGMESAFLLGFVPFISGELIKVLAVTAFLKGRSLKGAVLSKST